MNRGLLALFFFLVLGEVTAQVNGSYRLPAGTSSKDYSHEFIIVRFKEGYEISPPRSRSSGRSTQRELQPAIGHISNSGKANTRTSSHPLSNIYKVILQAGDDPIDIVNQYLQREEVLYAEPYFKHETLVVPNDPEANPLGGQQDHLTVIHAYDAWSIERGDTSIVIGVLDTGAEIDHSDLADNIAYNQDDPINGIDDDGDGLIDNFAGWDVADDDNNVAADSDSHGTRVAGTSSASTNNGLGIAGAGYNSQFLPIKVFSSFGGSSFNGYAGIVLAADLGCKVINLSWRTNFFAQFAQDVIDYAVLEKNAVVVAAAGNSNILENTFPASYNNVLSVAATNNSDEKASFSSFGYNVDLSAPGVEIFSTNNLDSYQRASGTSLSSPLVAGAAALVVARFPNLTAQQVMERLRVTSDDIYSVGINSSYTGLLGKGRLNMLKALTDNSSPSVRIQDFEYDNGTGSYAFHGDTLSISMNFKNFLSPTFGAIASISSESPYVQVITPSVTLGTIPTMGEADNFDEPFEILLSNDLPSEEVIVLRVDFEDGFYQDFQYITITSSPEFIAFNNGQLELTIDSDGDLGYSNKFFIGGTGFRRDGINLIKNIGLITAVHQDTVLDNAPINLATGTRGEDFIKQERVRFYTNSVADKDARLVFTDRPENDNALGLTIEQKTLAWDSTDFIIQEYRISNTSSGPINDLHTALHADWSLNDQNFNRAEWHDALKLGYAFDVRSDTLYSGIALLTDQSPIHYAINNKNFNGNSTDIPTLLNDSVKFSLVSQAIGKASAGGNNDGNDISQVIGGTIDQLPVNSSEKVALVLVSGNSLADLVNAVNEAQLRYTEYLSTPPLLETFFACAGEQVTIDPTSGNVFEFYNDIALTNLHFTGSEFTSPVLSGSIVYYAVNKDESFDGDVMRVIAQPKNAGADFDINPSPLLLDETGESSVQITDRSIDPVSWQWDFSHGFQANVQHPLVSYTAPGTYHIQLTVTNDLGCVGVTNRTVEVDNRSNLPDLNDLNICKEETVSLDPANATNIEVYSDSDLQDLIFTGTQYISGNLSNDTVFYVISKDSTYASNVRSVQVTVSSVKAEFMLRPDTVDLTHLHTIRMENRSVNHELFYWLIDDQLYRINSDTTYAYDIHSPFEVKLIAEDINGCYEEKTEIITPSPATRPASVMSSLCTGGQATFIAAESNFFNFYSDAEANQLVSKGSRLSFENVTHDTVIYYTDNQWYGESEVGRFNIEVAEVTAGFTLPLEELNIAETTSLLASNQSEGASTFDWKVNGISVSAEASPTLTFNEPGEFQIELTSRNETGCESSFSRALNVINITSLDERLEDKLIVYPNPVEDILTLIAPPTATFHLYNTKGRQITLNHISHKAIDLSALTPGMYILQIGYENNVIHQKILKK